MKMGLRILALVCATFLTMPLSAQEKSKETPDKEGNKWLLKVREAFAAKTTYRIRFVITGKQANREERESIPGTIHFAGPETAYLKAAEPNHGRLFELAKKGTQFASRYSGKGEWRLLSETDREADGILGGWSPTFNPVLAILDFIIEKGEHGAWTLAESRKTIAGKSCAVYSRSLGKATHALMTRYGFPAKELKDFSDDLSVEVLFDEENLLRQITLKAAEEKKTEITAEILDFEYTPGPIAFDDAVKTLLKIEEEKK